MQQIYDQLNKEAAKVAVQTGYDGEKPFRFSDYPQTKARVDKLQSKFVSEMGGLIYRGTSEEWKQSNLVQDLIADKVLKAYTAQVDREKYKVYYQTNSDALKAFQQRKDKGLNLSAKLWKQSKTYKDGLEAAISTAIQKGTSAVTLSKQISKYLEDFESLRKDYKERFGKATMAKDCEYRSIRLARSEINMAYRKAENERWRQMDFVIGYEIKPSEKHPKSDICDILKGEYPKDFEWTGWHPNCYSDDTYVLTDSGWKLFSDVKEEDLIMSLNTQTRNIEYVHYVSKQCYSADGKLLHFYNKSLDCLVTRDHRMVYLNKNDGRIKYCSAEEYTKGKGAFYRGCKYDADDVEYISIDKLNFKFDDFCEFMGYYLADGSLQRETGIILAQMEGQPAFEKMLAIIKKMGFTPHVGKEVIRFYNSSLCRYLKQFGKSYRKFVPSIIKNASKRQIRLFLDAFIICDGYKRPSKSFVGNRGDVFISQKEERLYFTTSERMAGDLSELLLKIEKRPSFRKKISSPHIISTGKIIAPNYPCYIINECNSLTSTEFKKEEVAYSGKVYDLTLERNHIMYVSRNGKSFWGSNCMDYKVPILKTEDEFFADGDTPSPNEVIDVPDEFKKWIGDNIQRAKTWSQAPYFVRDNVKYVQEEFKVNLYNEQEKSFVRKRRTRLAVSRVNYYKSVYPRVSEIRLAAINAYTQAISNGNRGATFREINKRLRNENLTDYVEIASDLISKGLKDLPKYEGKVYRGTHLSKNKFKELYLNHIGESIEEKAFISSSRYKDAPMQFMSYDGIPKSHVKVLFEIYSKNGRDISKISEFNGIFARTNQHEVLFDKGTKFIMTSNPVEIEGIVIIKMKEL